MTRIVAIAALALLGVVVRAAWGDTIALRTSVRLGHSGDVILAEVAGLSGPDAEALASTVVLAAETRRGAVEVRIEEVRAALDKAGAQWARLTLQGSSCAVIRPEADTPAPAPPADRLPRNTDPAPIPMGEEKTVRTAIGALLCRMYEVDPSDLRVSYDRADEELLNVPEAGRRIDVQPAGTANASRLPIAVWVYDGDRIVANATVRVDVLVRKRCVALTRSVRRGQMLAPDDLVPQTMWIPPGGQTAIESVGRAVGQEVRARLDAGTILRDDHLVKPLVIEKGDLVTVHCVSGGVVIKSPARALADGREGDLIEFRLERSKRAFLARVDGPGRAVVSVSRTLDAGALAAESESRP